jgi:hypothetical protein
MVFSDGDHSVQLNWYRADLYKMYVEDRSQTFAASASSMFGRPAVILSQNGRPSEILAQVDGKHMIDVALFGSDESTFSLAKSKLQVVGAEQWLDALPDSVFSGDRRNLAIDEMLTGLPVPPGFDIAALKAQGFVSDRYNLEVAVAGDVGCAWFDQWLDARKSGDTTAADHASQTLRASRNWPVLQEMSADGAYPQVFWDYADATENGKLPGEKTAPLTRNSVHNALGCA